MVPPASTPPVKTRTTMSKTYFITGSNKGIGLELVRILSKDESSIVITTVRETSKMVGGLSKLMETVSNIKVITLDLGSKESIKSIPSQLKTAGVEAIDVLINNGALGDCYVSMLDSEWEDFIRILNANSFGPIKLLQALRPFMLNRSTRQAFFVTTRLSALQDFIPIVGTAYTMSKTALNAGVKSCSVELKAEGFTIIAMEPGVCDTDIFHDGFTNPKSFYPEPLVQMITQKIHSAEVAAVGFVENVINKVTVEDSGKI